jgi:hypothetical protein
MEREIDVAARLLHTGRARGPIHFEGDAVFVTVDGHKVRARNYGPYEPLDQYLMRLAREKDKSRIHSQVYFIGGDHGPIKIGYSVSPTDRLKCIQAHSPIVVRILATTMGGQELEAAYHYRFARSRLHGEWFERAPSILAEIARLNSTEAGA